MTSPVDTSWAGYLRRMVERPGWSVARLARESGISTAQIWDWLRGKGAEGKVLVWRVLLIAEAFGDDPINALRAAAQLPPDRQRDEDIDRIMAADWPPDVKARMIDRLIAAREAPPTPGPEVEPGEQQEAS